MNDRAKIQVVIYAELRNIGCADEHIHANLLSQLVEHLKP
jgi:hypothetical protein